MSLVEQALKKLQETRRAVAGEPRRDAPLGVIREVSAPAAAAIDGAPATPRRIVQLDRNALVQAGFLPPDHKQRQIADQFRHVKRPLLAAALGRGVEPLPNGRMIMLASSLPGEGKTFVSVNLALSMSLERDISVLLVDADVAKPHISRLFGIAGEPGLLEALQDERIDVESLVLPTDIPKFSVLPAGQPIDTATELLASRRMQAVIARLAASQDRARVAIFDSPPLLLTSESRVLAQPMGQVVLVVQAGKTPQRAVHDAIACLGEGKPVSLLLNQSEAVTEAGYYYRDGSYGEYARYGGRQA
ncbi:MAG: AAA family ATPase [Steroidobacteraceae bacterium]|nr:AAA family ATPase [Steroidobacteraceae bacterium]